MKLGKLLFSIIIVSLIVSISIPMATAKKPQKPPPDVPPADPAIAFIGGGSRKVPGGVAVMNADGERQTVIYAPGEDGPVNNPTWSPDGTSIAFWRGQLPEWSIWAIDVSVINDEPQGSNLRMLADATAFDGQHGSYPEWSPAGDTIAVHGNRLYGNAGIYLIPASGIPEGGSAEKIFTPSGPDDGAAYVAWKSDATQMAFWYGDRSSGSVVISIKILDLTTSPAQVVNTLVEGEFTSVREMSWARTGDELAFAAEPVGGGEKSLYTLNIDSGAFTGVTDADDSPSWSSDDSHIVFDRLVTSRRKSTWTIFTVEVDTGVETELAKSSWMPDWKR
jgi:Tol biopolymer transport system component